MPCKKSQENRKLGRAIRAAHQQKGYSQALFARHAGVDRAYVGAVERGEFNVSLDTIVKIAPRLDTSAAALCAQAKI